MGAMNYKYDVFISYSQNDRDWARKLFSDLMANRLNVFFDKDRLDNGRPWEEQLRTALNVSRSLIVVWTDEHAGQSDWVARERAAFWLLPNLGSERLFISLNLEGHPQADARLQGIEDLITAGVDRANIGALDDAVWKKVIDRILLSLSGTVVPMPVVALTMTRAEADGLPEKDWRDIESQLGIAKAQGLAMYGDKRNEWTPYGGPDTIAQLLERLEQRINAQIKGPAGRYYWEFPPEAFWTDADVAADFAARLSSPDAPSLLVIDPIGIRNRDVLDRLYLFQDSIARNHIAILVLAPFVMPSASQMLRKWLLANARPYFSPLFQPAIPPKTIIEAHCALYSGDEDELLRLTWSAVGRGFRKPTQAAGQHPYLAL
jgi:hypothetical protein